MKSQLAVKAGSYSSTVGRGKTASRTPGTRRKPRSQAATISLRTPTKTKVVRVSATGATAKSPTRKSPAVKAPRAKRKRQSDAFDVRVERVAGASGRSFAELTPALKPDASRSRVRSTLRSAALQTPRIAPVEVVPGRAGDHADVQRLLLNVLHAPSRDEFHAWSEKPGYDPATRLLVKRGERVVSHLLTTDYALRFGETTLPVKRLHWLATLPEQRDQGLAGALLHEADRRMAADGTRLGVLRTTQPHFFARHGWAACVRETAPQCRARDVLARLARRPTTQDVPLSVRYWRHVELPALMRMYDRSIARTHGAVVRSEDDWRWLLSRKAFDHIMVAIHGRDRFDLEDTRAPLVGYAVMRGQKVVELVVDPAYPSAAERLLSRACGEMIEHDRQEISVNLAPGNEIERYLTDALPPTRACEADDVLMLKMVDPQRWLRSIHGELVARCRAAGLAPTAELGFLIDGEKFRLSLTSQGVKWSSGKPGRMHLSLRRSEFTRLATGHCDLPEAVAGDRVQASNRAAFELAEVLFPKLSWWRRPWDDQTA